MKLKIVPKQTLQETWEVVDEDGNVKWVCENQFDAAARIELEQDRRVIAGAYPQNLLLTEYPAGLFIIDDERRVFAVRAIEFKSFEEFANLVRAHPEDTFFLRDVKVVNGKSGLIYSIRFGTFSGDYYNN